MISRRELLKYGCLTGPLVLAGRNKPTGNDDHFYYKGWEVKWMGWHVMPPYLHQYCMYLARYKGEGDTILYASYPGKSGITKVWYAIDTTPKEEKGQVTVCPFSTEADLKKYQLICKKDILRVIDTYKDPMAHGTGSA